MLKKSLALILMFLPMFGYSAETDHYTLADSEITDITGELNSYSNSSVADILEKLNQEGACNAKVEVDPFSSFDEDYDDFDTPKTPEQRLYEELTQVFANHSKSKLIDDFLSGNITRTVIPLKESVYKEWSKGNGFLLGRDGAANSPLALSPLIKVGGVVIGVDKLEHMFGMGYAYFKRHHKRGMSLRRTLKIGILAEKTYLGGNMLATGVFTYADLAANFNGMRFWNHMLQKEDDVLGKTHNYGPYITCDAGKWKQDKEIDFTNYVDMSMQENVNCSKFATKKGVEKFKASLSRLHAKNKGSRSFSCPSSADALEEAASKYLVPMKDGTTIEHWIINRDGNEKVSYFNEF
jgi:hypothetical protein